MKRSILPGSSAEHGAIACMSLKWPDDFRTQPITQMKLPITNAIAMAILGAEYVLRMLPRGTHRYERFLKPSELRRALLDLGFDQLEYEGLSYDPFTRRARRRSSSTRRRTSPFSSTRAGRRARPRGRC